MGKSQMSGVQGNFLRFGVCLLVGVGLILASLSPALAKSRKSKAPKENRKYAALVMDASTGEILFERNPDKQLHPASLTKIMTLLLTFDALESGRISLNTPLRVSRRAAAAQPSKLGVPAGKAIRTEDAIYALVTKSANDIAITVAENLGGSEDEFARRMTLRARQIGMNSTRFVNASGLHNPKQVTTARDMATLARYVIGHYPRYYRYFSARSFRYKGAVHQNHNHLMKSYAGMDGMKTGYIVPSGFNLVASAKRDGRRLIGVVFGGTSTSSRNAHMAEILDQGFDKMRHRPLTQMVSAEPPVERSRPAPAIIAAAPAPMPARVAQPVTVASLRDVSPAADRDAPRPARKPDQPQLTQLLDPSASADRGQSRQIQSLTVARLEPAGTVSFGDRVRKAAIPQSGVETESRRVDGAWSIQIGAFRSPAQTAEALSTARQKLPQHLAAAAPVVETVRSGSRQIYRARLSGYSRNQARQACRFFNDCLTIAP